MATTKKTTAPVVKEASQDEPVKKPGTALAKWEEQLAADAAEVSKMEASTNTGSFFKTKAGQLSWDDAPLPNNEMAVVIVDSILENVTYDADYDPDDPSGPICFAYGRDEAEMAPHELVVAAGQAVHAKCVGCPRNEFGSADKGSGKACRNTRRLAVVPAGKLDIKTGKFIPIKRAEELSEAPLGYLKVPPTSIRSYSAYVKQLAGSLKRPPHGIFTKIKLVPDAKSQFKVTFDPLAQVPNELLGAVMARREEAKIGIMAPYQLGSGDEPATRSRGKAPAAKKASPTARKTVTNKKRF